MKIRLKLIRTLALLLACLFVEQAAAASNDVAISLYNRWEHLDGHKLIQMGYHYRNVARQPDSAMVCFSIVANRYYDKHLTDADRHESVHAFQMMGRTYFFEYEDFIKADSIIALAAELAQRHHYDDLLPDILIDRSSITKGLRGVVHDSYGVDTVSLNMLKTAFHLAYKNGNWESAKASFFNLMLDCIMVNEDQYVGGIMDSVLRVMPESVRWRPLAVQLIGGVRACNNGDLKSALTHLQAFKTNLSKSTSQNEQPSAFMMMVLRKT